MGGSDDVSGQSAGEAGIGAKKLKLKYQVIVI